MNRSALYILAGLFLTCVHVITNLPLVTALHLSGASKQGLRWSSAEGTLWQGEVKSVAYGAYPVGDVSIRSYFLPMLAGKWGGQYSIRGSGLIANGRASVGLNRKAHLVNNKLSIDLAAYNIRDAFDAPMRGSLEVDIKEMRLTPDGCKHGQFYVWTDSLESTAGRYGGEGFPLEGAGFCENGEIKLSMLGAGTQEKVLLEMQLAPSLDYEAEVQVSSQTPDLIAALKFYGFDTRGEDLVMIQRGNLLANP